MSARFVIELVVDAAFSIMSPAGLPEDRLSGADCSPSAGAGGGAAGDCGESFIGGGRDGIGVSGCEPLDVAADFAAGSGAEPERLRFRLPSWGCAVGASWGSALGGGPGGSGGCQG